MGKHAGRLKIVPYTNDSGRISWRVTGTINGVRWRKNFLTRMEAEAEVQRHVAGQLRAQAPRPVFTTLTEEEVRAAEIIFRGRKVAEVIRAVEESGDRAAVPKELSAAVVEFLAEQEASGVRPSTVSVRGYQLRDFIASTPARFTTELNRSDVERWVFCPSVTRNSHVSRKQRAGQFIRWCVDRGYLARDISQGMRAVRVEGRLPRVLTVKQGRALMRAAEDVHGGRMVPYFALNLFSGIRPTECMRLEASAIRLDVRPRVVEIGPEVAKVRQCRMIPVEYMLGAWLKEIPEGPVGWWRRSFDEVRVQAKVAGVWELDIMRHSYASYWYALNKDAVRLSYAMGNSTGILFRNYVRPVTEKDARAWFKIGPARK